MAHGAIDTLPGFRRRMRVDPGPESVRAAFEDDIHCMHVVLHHDGKRIAAVEGVMERAPWTTCPGAAVQLRETFEGIELGDAATRGEKRLNCTHLHDLAVLAAAHAGDSGPTVYDILVSDPIDGRTVSEIRRDGVPVLTFTIDGFEMVEPAVVAGRSIIQLRDWIASLEPLTREAARLLQWVTIVAHGRVLPMEAQSDATKIPPNCYTFQPHRAVNAVRVGKIIDFSADGVRQPLESN